MSFTVVHANGTTADSDYREYLRVLSRVLLKQGVNLADVPRVEDPATGKHWLYVWPTEDEAQGFAQSMNEHTEAGEWVVRSVETSPSRGPLRPLEIEVGRHGRRWTFALAPWARKALQTQFPGSCQKNTVTVTADEQGNLPTTQPELEKLAEQMLLILAGLEREQLQRFGSYVLTDPVTGERLLPPTPIQS
jgi:hypothetical protein